MTTVVVTEPDRMHGRRITKPDCVATAQCAQRRLFGRETDVEVVVQNTRPIFMALFSPVLDLQNFMNPGAFAFSFLVPHCRLFARLFIEFSSRCITSAELNGAGPWNASQIKRLTR